MNYMAAPKGNKFAVGNHGGRPTKYKPEYCQKLVEYFSIEPNKRELVSVAEAYGKKGNTTFTKKEWKNVPNRLPTLIKFCQSIGITQWTLLEWVDKHDEFSQAYAKAKELYKNFLIENGVLGLYNAAFTIFVAKNTTDMKDKQEVEHSGITGVVFLPALKPDAKVIEATTK